jgi:threonine 3-dehydrogenase
MDPLGNAVHSSLSFNILGEDVLITGAGPIGLMAVPIIRRAGARNIVVTDVNDNRLEMARTLGATATVNVGKHKISSVFGKLGIKEGFDVGLEMSGSPAALRDQISAMHSGGKIALLGIFPAPVEIDMEAVVFKSLTLRGIYGRQMFDTWYRTTALLQSGLADDLAPIITHRFHFSEFERGFDAMKTGDCGKVILEWT